MYQYTGTDFLTIEFTAIATYSFTHLMVVSSLKGLDRYISMNKVVKTHVDIAITIVYHGKKLQEVKFYTKKPILIIGITVVKNMKGFTLIELLVSVAILGVLAALAASNYDEFRRRANDAVVISQIRNLITAYEASYIEHADYNHNNLYAIDFAFDGTITNNASLTTAQLLPGFVHQSGVQLGFAHSTCAGLACQSIIGIHCMPSTYNLDGYPLSTMYFWYSGSNITKGSWTDQLLDGSACP